METDREVIYAGRTESIPPVIGLTAGSTPGLQPAQAFGFFGFFGLGGRLGVLSAMGNLQVGV